MKNAVKILAVILSIFLFYSCKKKDIPTVTTEPVTNIEMTQATSGGTITDDGNAEVVDRGICWSTEELPSVTDSKTHDGIGLGFFKSTITLLTPNTTYYVRAYATNSEGSAYGAEMSFTTLGEVPTVTTLAATNLAPASATLNGTVNANYLSTIVTFEYGLTTSYGSTTTATQSPVMGSTSTNVSAGITGLSLGTTYHFRIIGVNTLGTTYGSDNIFSTTNIPTLNTTHASALTMSTASSGGNIISDGGAAIIAKGVCWSTSQNPTVNDSKTMEGTGSENFLSTLTGLMTNTYYYVRSYAINSAGIGYGNEVKFNLWMGISTDWYRDRQGNLYWIVRIGDQLWLGDNIRSTVFQIDGEDIPLVTDADEWKNLTTPAYCWFNNDEAQKLRGALYNWYAVNTGKLCPSGWHVSTDSDWKKLEMYLGMSQTEADAELWRGTTQSSLLKNASAWSNSGNTNLSGFSARPGYYRHASGVFADYGDSIYEYASWWTSSESSSEYVINRALDYNSPGVYRNTSQGKNGGQSVRCVMD